MHQDNKDDDDGHQKQPSQSDEEMRKLLKPCPSNEDVYKILQTSYNFNGNSDSKVLQQLDSYDDCNYKVEINRIPYLLKIHNGVESKDFLKVYDGTAGGDYYKKGCSGSVVHFQNAILQVLHEENIASSVPVNPVDSNVPVSIHTLPVVSVTHGPCRLVVRLLQWVPGRPMATVSLLPLEALADAGRYLGRLDAALDKFLPESPVLVEYRRRESIALIRLEQRSAPSIAATRQRDDSLLIPARRYHQWDGKNTADLLQFTHCIQDNKRRAMVESVIAAFQSELLDTGVSLQLRKGINHSDYNGGWMKEIVKFLFSVNLFLTRSASHHQTQTLWLTMICNGLG
jgi:Ser/Thr protein kinase RdoA (MazF antagonist)